MAESGTAPDPAKAEDSLGGAGIAGIIAAAVGVVLLCCPWSISVASPPLLALGLGGVTYSVLRTATGARRLAVVPAVGVLVLTLAVVGFFERTFDKDNHRYRAGVEVTAAATGADCTYGANTGDRVVIRRRRGNTPDLTCPATWTVDGRQRTGKLHVEAKDYDVNGGPFTITAYALGGEASSISKVDVNYGLSYYTRVPLWVGLAALLFTVLGIGVLLKLKPPAEAEASRRS